MCGCVEMVEVMKRTGKDRDAFLYSACVGGLCVAGVVVFVKTMENASGQFLMPLVIHYFFSSWLRALCMSTEKKFQDSWAMVMVYLAEFSHSHLSRIHTTYTSIFLQASVPLPGMQQALHGLGGNLG